MNQLNLLQENSNLPIDFKIVEEYLLQKQSVSPLNFTTGLYGMLVFSKMIDNLFKEKNLIRFKITNTNIAPTTKTLSEERFVKYKLFNGKEMKLIHDKNLDNTGNINEHIGFTIESTILYLKN